MKNNKLNNQLNNRRIIIAGGKTGGHLFPGIAVAQALQSAGPGVEILFVGTNAPFEINTLAAYGFAHKTIVSRPIKGKKLLTKLYSASLVLVSLIQALLLIIRFRADFILGVGGFSSFALVLAGRLLGRATAIQEQNAVPGMTNRMLAKIAKTIFISFETTRGMPINHKTFLVGTPIRQAQAQGNQNQKTAGLSQVKPDDFLILVTGGSQGAASLNKAATQAFALMDDTQGIFIIHQTGDADETEVLNAYKALNIPFLAQAFFHDMPTIQDRADLVITRAGAGTLSELAIKGKPSILVPFPHAADDHQTANARCLADKGAAILIPDKDLTGETLHALIEDLEQNSDKLDQMGKAMLTLAMPHGAQTIADHILTSNKERG